jgi:hypothetical protein
MKTIEELTTDDFIRGLEAEPSMRVKVGVDGVMRGVFDGIAAGMSEEGIRAQIEFLNASIGISVSDLHTMLLQVMGTDSNTFITEDGESHIVGDIGPLVAPEVPE